ncbi:hypothetical protein FHW96_001415 [Novosphingobium sp. SG751A]|uniref:hypothetical protein n=1 Tax=Novosphingobium sp. SG751A TaxID=2587000 RepID=UPI00155165AC|nr:hypothetical protein [Novosphingobium sp. SG751A]NOW45260.1 hypothetical protein [Novosphingobium sp. SG751A]
MSGPNISRRAMLGAMAVLPGMGMAPRAWAAGACHFILDARLPEAAAIRAKAEAAGHRSADPEGEIVRLLLSDEGRQMAGTIIGLTTYSDYILARDILRMRHRQVDRPHALPDGDAGDLRLASLRDACARRCASRATSFLWLA